MTHSTSIGGRLIICVTRRGYEDEDADRILAEAGIERDLGDIVYRVSCDPENEPPDFKPRLIGVEDWGLEREVAKPTMH